MVLAEDFGAQKGLAMLIRSQNDGISGEVALAAGTAASPAAILPTLLIGGLLLTCP
jgi:L-aminopeptidase/D-esterase-like protein